MSKARERVEEAARKAGIKMETIKNLTNVEVWNLIKDKTGKDVPKEVKEGEIVSTSPQKAVMQVPPGAQIGFVLNPAPVTLLPTAAPFNQDSYMYPVWACTSAIAQWLQPNIVGFLIGVLVGGHVLKALGIGG